VKTEPSDPLDGATKNRNKEMRNKKQKQGNGKQKRGNEKRT